MITTLDVGGAERLMVDLLPLLRNKGFDVELLLFDGVETALKDEFSKTGIKIHELSRGRQLRNYKKIYNPYNIIRLKKFLKGYDVIHTHNTACQLFVPLAILSTRSKTKLVTTEHNTTNRRRSLRWFKPIDKWMYKQYDSIVCISDQTYDNLIDYICSDSKVRTIYNGVDVNRFLKPIKRIEGHNQFIVTMVAAFREQKDHSTLLKAMTLLPDNYSLRLVGQGDTEESVKQYCSKLGLDARVEFMGLRMDIPNLLAESDINVLSSHWEGFGLVAVEGMASGRPFIASDVDGLRDVVGGAGILFPHGDAKALANLIKELCENPRYYKQVAQACQERANNYDISKMAASYHALYESLLQAASKN